MERTILHSDMNSCYASIELLHHPELRGRPMAVGGDPEKRHGIVLAKDQLAKKAGVKTGMALWQARQVCPEIVFVPPDMDKYIRFSKMAHELYGEYTDMQEPFGIDECWLDVTASGACKGDGLKIAQEIRSRMKEELGVTVSIGVSWNKIFAKFGSDYKKPDAVTRIGRDNYREIIWDKDVGDLLFVGRATKNKLNRHGIFTIGQLADTDPAFLKSVFGKMGLVLHAFALGEDQTPVNKESFEVPIKSIGNGITTPRDLVSEDDVKIIVRMLSESVCRRLREHHFKGLVVELYIRDADLSGVVRQHRRKRATDLCDDVVKEAMDLFRANYRWEKPVRNLTVRVADLICDQDDVQLEIGVDEEKRMKKESMDRVVDDVRKRYGDLSIMRCRMLTDMALTGQAAVKDHEVHPHGYFEAGNRTGVYDDVR